MWALRVFHSFLSRGQKDHTQEDVSRGFQGPYPSMGLKGFSFLGLLGASGGFGGLQWL